MVNMEIAKTAYKTAKSMGASPKVLLALFETGLVESGFKNYANPNVPESLKIPHDAVGSDHASVGFLQQQVPSWGTAAQCMDTAYATRAFVTRAMARESAHPTAGTLAQAVQVSAFPDRYDARESDALKLLAQVAVAPPVSLKLPTAFPIDGVTKDARYVPADKCMKIVRGTGGQGHTDQDGWVDYFVTLFKHFNPGYWAQAKKAGTKVETTHEADTALLNAVANLAKASGLAWNGAIDAPVWDLFQPHAWGSTTN